MTLTSTAFPSNGSIPTANTCQGDGKNPPLMITGTPSGTRSLVLIVHDPDASMDFTHWVTFNIPTETTEIHEGAGSPGTEGVNGRGENGYFGPCPPSGTHHYHFDLYALDTTLELTSGASRDQTETAMRGHILEQTTLIGTYAKH